VIAIAGAGAIIVLATHDAKKPEVAATQARWTVARRLPVLPASGIAVRRGSQTLLLDPRGKRILVLPGVRVMDGAMGEGAPLFEQGSALLKLDARRHRLLKQTNRKGTFTASGSLVRITLSEATKLPAGCVPIVSVSATTFATCDLQGELKGAIIAVRGGSVHTLVAPDKERFFFSFEVAPDSSSFVAQRFPFATRSSRCRVNNMVLVDTATSRTMLLTAAPLGYVEQGTLVVRRSGDCATDLQDVVAIEPRGSTTIARGVEAAAFWGDAGH
jgi:hypothetical protein